ncbi:unnamed protein product [Microthlaspi erraticum]|uniref:FBD domain-containing protein n=1 Tax=Microthlaspi erraticum TaxID=1685480 RepID=A0A6D2HYU9_9BRAS|nr:unnamed protein product [Microthlaspi erraticum]
MVPKLEFETHSKNVNSFFESVGRSLLSHKAPILESLHLKVFHKCDAVDIGIWTGIAFARHVRELELDVSFRELVRFPSSLLISNTLETLKLNCSVLVDVSSTVCMKSLRTLHLKSAVRYKDDESVRNLLSGCPNLENLLVHRPYNNVVVNFNIVVPSLKTLSIRDFTSEQKNGGYVINTPSLKFLSIERLKGYKFCLTEDASELVEANISNVSDIADENIFGSLKSAKRLSLGLSPMEIAYPTGVIFSQLVYLEIDTHRAEWWNLLTFMLENSPKLQVLKLNDKSLRSNENIMVGGKWNQPEYVPECLLSHLRTFLWTRYDCEREEEKEVATYILRNAKQLKKATFSARPIQSKELNKLEQRCEMLKELEGMVRASNSCHIIVSE